MFDVFLQPAPRPPVMQMIAVKQRNQNINVKQGPHQMPSSSRSLSINSLLTTLPLEGKGLTRK